MLTENVIIVGSQDLSGSCKNELVDAFIRLNIYSRQNLTSNAQVGRKYTVAAYLKTKYMQSCFLRCLVTKSFFVDDKAVVILQTCL